MVEWAVRLDQTRPNHLSELRLRNDIKVGEVADQVWLRGECENSVDPPIRSLPGDHFTIACENQLVPVGKQVPLGFLPTTDWRSLREWLQVSPPVARWAKAEAPTARLSLQSLAESGSSNDFRSAVASEDVASAILVTLDVWHSYADSAPQVRLGRLRFAAAADGRILVLGTPLPPLPGTHFVIIEQIAIPAGRRWVPNIDPTVVRSVFGVSDSLVLWYSTDSWELIPPDAFVAATRMAIRSTFSSLKEALQDEAEQ